MPRRRDLRLKSFDEAIAEIERLRDGAYTPRGRWSLSQVCDHLTKTMRVGLDGHEPRMPWVVRKVFGVVIRWMLRRGRMFSGAVAPGILQPTAPAEDPATIELCLATLAECRDRRDPIPPYLLCDGLSLDDWKRLMVIHAQHHLGFLEPAA